MFKFLGSLISKVFVTVLVLGGAWVAYVMFSDTEAAPPSLPELPGHNTTEGQVLTGYLGNFSEGAAELVRQPELAQKAALIDRIITCYQGEGAVQSRLYSNQETPISAGVVAIADRNVLLNPKTFLGCTEGDQSAKAASLSVTIKPCSQTYTVARDNNEYYILYAGTTAEICQAICSQLEGCTANQASE